LLVQERVQRHLSIRRECTRVGDEFHVEPESEPFFHCANLRPWRRLCHRLLCLASGRDDTNPTSLPRAGFLPNDDLDILVERRQQVHQAFDGDARQLVVTQRRHLRLRHSQHIAVISFTNASVVDLRLRLHGYCHGRNQPGINEVSISTLHSLAIRLLRRAHLLENYPRHVLESPDHST